MKIENQSNTTPENDNRFRPYHVAMLALLIVGTVFVATHEQGFQRKIPFQMEEGKIFGTVYHIKYQSEDDLHDSIVARLNSVDASLSMFNPSSTLSCINRGESMKADSLITSVWNLAQSISEDTDGSFDPTVAPLAYPSGTASFTRKIPG